MDGPKKILLATFVAAVFDFVDGARRSHPAGHSSAKCPAMHQVHTGILVGCGLLLVIGCASRVPESSPTGTIFEVKISDVIPEVITVRERDEVRWFNMTDSTVHISLTKPVDARLSCLKGFDSGHGFDFVGSPTLDVTIGATVNSHEFASLCFSDSGIYNYTVRREHETKLGGTVMVK